MEDNILTTVKQFSGIPKDDTSFDLEILLHTNTSLLTLYQIIDTGMVNEISVDRNSVWNDLTKGNTELDCIKSYLGLKVKLKFDPPSSSVIVDALNRNLDEIEWRLSNININKEVTSDGL